MSGSLSQLSSQLEDTYDRDNNGGVFMKRRNLILAVGISGTMMLSMGVRNGCRSGRDNSADSGPGQLVG